MTILIRCSFLSACFGLALAIAIPLKAQAQVRDHKPRVALVMKSLADEFFVKMEEGAKDYQKQHSADFDLLPLGIKNQTDTSEQIRIVEEMIVSKVDGIVIAPTDSKAMVPVVKKAIDAGILVVNIDNRLDPEVLKSKGIKVPFVGPDNRKGARLAGDYLAQHLKAGDEVGIVEGISTTANAQQRTAGFKDAMTAAGMKVVSVQSGDWEIDKGNAVSSAMLSEYPNLKAILCGNDDMAIGAVSAIRAAGRAGKVYVVGYNNIVAIRPMLANGRVLATVDQFADQQAIFGINTVLQALREHRPQSALSDVVETNTELVTKK